MGMSPVNMNFMQSQGASAVPAFNFDASNLTAIAEQYGMPTSAFGDMSALGEGAQGLGEAPSLNFLDSLDSVVEKYSKSDASSSTPAAKQFTSMMTEYFKKFCPGMSEEQISALCNMYAEQYADLAKAMDLSSLTASVASSSASGSSGASGVSGGGGSIDASQVEGTAWGKSLAQDAAANATGSGGWCYKYVAEAVARQGGGTLTGGSAYMAADQLAKNGNFKEVSGVSDADLRNLPAGCIVVWDRGNGQEHGHICVSLGDGREASDVIRPMTQGYGTSFRVFQPVK